MCGAKLTLISLLKCWRNSWYDVPLACERSVTQRGTAGSGVTPGSSGSSSHGTHLVKGLLKRRQIGRDVPHVDVVVVPLHRPAERTLSSVSRRCGENRRWARGRARGGLYAECARAAYNCVNSSTSFSNERNRLSRSRLCVCVSMCGVRVCVCVRFFAVHTNARLWGV